MDWIVIVVLIFGSHQEPHATGPFSSETNCWRWVEMYTMGDREFLATCATEARFREWHPDLTVEGGT